MTFLENLAPLLTAAEKYAKITSQVPQTPSPDDIVILAARDKAKDALLAAAIEYAKWGKSKGTEI